MLSSLLNPASDKENTELSSAVSNGPVTFSAHPSALMWSVATENTHHLQQELSVNILIARVFRQIQV